MFTIDPSFLGKLGTALLVGDDGLLKRAVKTKLRQLSREMFNELTGGVIPSAVKAGRRAQRPFNQLRRQWLGVGDSDDISEQSIYEQLIETVEHGGSASIRRGLHKRGKQTGWQEQRRYWQYHRPGSPWARAEWASSREDWMENAWRHDWRSQPRDPKGMWLEGRLDYIPAHLKYKGKRAGRTVRSYRRKKRARRAAARAAFSRLEE